MFNHPLNLNICVRMWPKKKPTYKVAIWSQFEVCYFQQLVGSLSLSHSASVWILFIPILFSRKMATSRSTIRSQQLIECEWNRKEKYEFLDIVISVVCMYIVHMSTCLSISRNFFDGKLRIDSSRFSSVFFYFFVRLWYHRTGEIFGG